MKKTKTTRTGLPIYQNPPSPPLPISVGADPKKVQWSGYGELGNISQKTPQPTIEDSKIILERNFIGGWNLSLSEFALNCILTAIQEDSYSVNARRLAQKMVDEKLRLTTEYLKTEAIREIAVAITQQILTYLRAEACFIGEYEGEISNRIEEQITAFINRGYVNRDKYELLQLATGVESVDIEKIVERRISEHYYPKEKYDELLQQRDELKEALISMMWQFAYYGTKNNVAVMQTGGLSALEDAFVALGLSDPITVADFEAAIKNTER